MITSTLYSLAHSGLYRMRSLSVFMIFQTAVISSLVHGSHGDRGCTGFTFDPSPYEDDSDYQDGASGSNNFDIGGSDIVFTSLLYCIISLSSLLWSYNDISSPTPIVILPYGLPI